ncbi:unnamed protein product [Camellia sinensis]
MLMSQPCNILGIKMQFTKSTASTFSLLNGASKLKLEHVMASSQFAYLSNTLMLFEHSQLWLYCYHIQLLANGAQTGCPASSLRRSSTTLLSQLLMSLLTKSREVFPGTWESLFPILNSSALVKTNLQDQFHKLTGKVPNLVRLQNLKGLSIGDNQLGSREADDLNFIHSLINATNLQHLDVGVNNFGCKFPESIGNLSSNLQVLYLDNNQIFGIIPPGIVNLVGSQSLNMQHNQFTGTIPSVIGKLQNLHQLNLFNNSLSGNIPSSLGNLSLLSKLVLGPNNFQGNIPPSLGNCSNLQKLSLSQNNLNGTIPKQVVSISSLSVYLDLS